MINENATLQQPQINRIWLHAPIQDIGHIGYYSYYSNNYSFSSFTVNGKNDRYNP